MALWSFHKNSSVLEAPPVSFGQNPEISVWSPPLLHQKLFCLCHVCFFDYVTHERRDLLVVLVVQSRSLHCCEQKNTLFYFLDTHPSVYHSSQQGKFDMNIISSQENTMLYIYIWNSIEFYKIYQHWDWLLRDFSSFQNIAALVCCKLQSGVLDV